MLRGYALHDRPESVEKVANDMSHQWTASWITSPTPMLGAGPLPLFRRAFSIQRTPAVKRATLRVCGLGQFELRLNGNKIGDDVLEPGWTNYRKTCLYLTRDVTPQILPGDNVIGVMLGNGMYNVMGTRYKKFKGTFGPPKLIAELLIELDDGSIRLISSDDTWKTSSGPIAFGCIFGGEDYDARLDQSGWDQNKFDDTAWTPASRCDGPGGALVEQLYTPIRVMKSFQARPVNEVGEGVRLFDTGQNMSGWPALVLAGRAGATVTLKIGEQLDESGRVTQKNIGGPVTFSYTSKSDKEESWHPRFSLTGFRYVEATGDIDTIKSVSGHFVHNSAKVVGGFSCSNDLLNRIHELILAAVRSNFQSVFTDCPHREKLGWLEQAHLMAPSILYNLDAASLYAKMMRDTRDSQHENGMVPTTAPQFTVFKPEQNNVFNDSPEWGAACVLAPWFVYRHTGDVSILRENYDVMARFVDYLTSRADDRGIVAYGLGDWYDIGPGDPGFSKLTTIGVTGTATLVQCLDALKRFAELLGKPDDAESFGRRREAARAAFNATYYDAEAKRYDKGSQCAQGMALALKLCDEAQCAAVLEALVADIRANNNHITAGDIGYRYVLAALAENGRSDVIFDMLSRTDPPSYGSQLARGATTLTEAWDANPKNSLNHMMLGHAEEWFHRYLAGIRVDLAARADEAHVIFAPTPVGDVTWTKAFHEVPAGRIECSWTRKGDAFTLDATVPKGLRARVEMPTRDRMRRDLPAGAHRFAGAL